MSRSQQLTAPQGVFQLVRYPERSRETLRAWDAADEYVLSYIHENNILKDETELLILNDGSGALSVALADFRPRMMSDSYLSHRAVGVNLEKNGKVQDSVRLLNSLQCTDALCDLVIIKISRHLALLEDQLFHIRQCLKPDTLVIGAGMVKNIHTSTLDLFERIIGPTKTSLARKKARLVFSQPDLTHDPGKSPYPSHYTLENTDYRIANPAGVFSREKLDNGTRLLIEHIHSSSRKKNIIDLGCGNGVVGIVAAERNPKAEITFVDESFMAVAAAETNFRAIFGPQRPAHFRVMDCLRGIREDSADLILNNPPFHQDRAVDDAVAWQMFFESKGVLQQGGELIVVGNRHLGYHTKLKRLFGNCRTISGNNKFVILKSVK